MPLYISSLQPSDWDAVSRIYRQGIETGNATFETTVPDWSDWDESRLQVCRFVARDRGTIVGWAALSPVSSRQVYSGVAEVSAYVDADHQRRGVGGSLMDALVAGSERAGVWTLQAGIFPENEASLALHRRFGFRVVGRRKQIGQLHGQWRDTILVERRMAE